MFPSTSAPAVSVAAILLDTLDKWLRATGTWEYHGPEHGPSSMGSMVVEPKTRFKFHFRLPSPALPLPSVWCFSFCKISLTVLPVLIPTHPPVHLGKVSVSFLL